VILENVDRRLVVVRRLLIVLAVAIPLVLAACDDDEDTTAATTETTTGAEAPSSGGQSVNVSETDFALDPPNPTVKAGTVRFEVTNDGQTAHNLEIEGDGVEEELEADLQPGDGGTLTVDLQPGTYEYYCPVANHKDLGMEGELTVE
jgi:plastocyanin